jgi:hypothetical protein
LALCFKSWPAKGPAAVATGELEEASAIFADIAGLLLSELVTGAAVFAGIVEAQEAQKKMKAAVIKFILNDMQNTSIIYLQKAL